MARSRHPRLLALLSAVGALGVGAFVVLGQAPGPDSPAAFLTGDVVRLPADRSARQRLEAAAEYIEAERWPEAARLLQSLLDAPEDVFVPLQWKDGKPVRHGSLRVEAERLLAAMPAAGFDLYRTTQGARAQRLLKEAREARDVGKLDELARRYRFTPAGAEALTLLGTYHLDRGRPDVAAAYFRRLLDGREEPSAHALFLAALAFQGSGDPAARDRAWEKLAPRIPKAGLLVGDQRLDRERLKEEIARWPAATSVPPGSLWRGDARRSAVLQGDVPLLEPCWRFQNASAKAIRLLRRALQRLPAGAPLLPGAVPICVNGLVYYRSPYGVHAVDAVSGRERWRTPSPLGLDGLLGDPGRGVQLEHWFASYLQAVNGDHDAAAVLYEHSVPGTLSGDSRRVYLVEDLALPPNPNLLDETVTGRKPLLGPMRHLIGHNRLRALDSRTGKLLWEIGGQGPGIRPAALADAYFLGPPLPLAGRLLAVIEKGAELSLVTLDPDRGDVVAVQKLATLLRSKLLTDVPRRVQAVHLAYDGGVLVCSTNAGVVLGLDAVTHNLLWAHLYRDKPTPAPPEGTPPFNPDEYHAGWKASAAVVAQGRVLFTAPDADEVRCLDLKSGALLWKAARSEDDVYLAGVFGDKVLLVGRTACRALSLTGGRELWRHPTGTPSGQGVAGGPYYYLPLKDGTILALHLASPKASVRMTCRDGRAPGNLLFAGDCLWSQTAFDLTAYPQLEPTLRRLGDVLARRPNDLDALAERGTLLLSKGDLSGAAADLRAALTLKPPPVRAAALRERLFETLTHLLQTDFGTGEKYLDDYRALCRVPAPAEASPAERARLAEDERRRLLHYHLLVARGRETQGRVNEAIDGYRAVLETAPPGELLSMPGETGVRCRADAWVRGRVARMAARATPEQRRRLLERMERDRDREARFLDLFGGLDGELGASARAVRFRLAEAAAANYDPPRALAADLLLREMEDGATAADAARILDTRARLLTRYGLPEDAIDCWRRVARDLGAVRLPDGKTGVGRLREVESDRRFFAYVCPDRPGWEGRKLRPATVRGTYPESPWAVARLGEGSLDYRGGVLNLRPPPALRTAPGVGRFKDAPPSSMRDVRLILSFPEPRLQVCQENGTEAWNVPLPSLLTTGNVVPACVFWQQVGHQGVLAAGPQLLGVDLLERRLRWRVSLDDLAGPGNNAAATVWVLPTGIYVQGRAGLTAFDLATGRPRWVRADVTARATLLTADRHLYLAEYRPSGEVGSVRAVRTIDGTLEAIPDSTDVCANLLDAAGHLVLATARGPRDELVLRWHDLRTGKDVWRKDFPDKSLPLTSAVPGLVAVVTPRGEGTVLEWASGRVLARVRVEAGYVEKVRGGYLLADRERFYFAFTEVKDPAHRLLDGPHPNFSPALGPTLPIDGRLYAFARADGELCWFKPMPNQMLLLDRFDELPVVLCSATTTRAAAAGRKAVQMAATRTVDKRTGKLLHNLEGPFMGEGFHTLAVNRRAGIVDLVGTSLKLRILPEP